MRDFMREADKRNYRIDYIGVHWYGATSPRAFKERMAQVYEAYGKATPIDLGVRGCGLGSQDGRSKQPLPERGSQVHEKCTPLDGKTKLDRRIRLVLLRHP